MDDKEIRSDGSHEEQSEDEHPLVVLLQSRPVKLVELLQKPKLLEEIDKCVVSFSHELMTQMKLKRQMIDCILEPWKPINGLAETPVQYPYICCQIYTNLDQSFTKHLLEQVSASPNNNLVVYMLKILESTERLNETSLGYLLKLITHLLYHQEGYHVMSGLSKILAVFHLKPQFIGHIVRHSYSNSIVEILILLFAVERSDTEQQDFTQTKKNILNMLISSLLVDSEPKSLPERIDSVADFIYDFLEKAKDNDRFRPFVDGVISTQTIQIAKEIIVKNINHQKVVGSALRILDGLLAYYQSREIRPSSFYVKGSEEVFTISQVVLSTLTQTIRQLFATISILTEETKNLNDCCLPLAEFLRDFCLLYPEEGRKIIKDDIARWAIGLFQKFPWSNILHGMLIIILQIYVQSAPPQILTESKEVNLLNFIRKQFDAKHGYHQHLVMLLDRFLEQPTQDPTKLNETINQVIGLAEWQSIKQKYQKIKSLQKEDLCHEEPNKRDSELFLQNGQQRILMKYDPIKDTNVNIDSLFQSANSDEMDMLEGEQFNLDGPNVKLIESPVICRYSDDPKMPLDDNIFIFEAMKPEPTKVPELTEKQPEEVQQTRQNQITEETKKEQHDNLSPKKEQKQQQARPFWYRQHEDVTKWEMLTILSRGIGGLFKKFRKSE